MTIKELIKILKSIDNQNMEVFVACDEEWNILFGKIDIEIRNYETKGLVLFGLSGSELDDRW